MCVALANDILAGIIPCNEHTPYSLKPAIYHGGYADILYDRFWIQVTCHLACPVKFTRRELSPWPLKLASHALPIESFRAGLVQEIRQCLRPCEPVVRWEHEACDAEPLVEGTPVKFIEYSVPIPKSAQTRATKFRWRQAAPRGLPLPHRPMWVLDDVYIELTHVRCLPNANVKICTKTIQSRTSCQSVSCFQSVNCTPEPNPNLPAQIHMQHHGFMSEAILGAGVRVCIWLLIFVPLFIPVLQMCFWVWFMYTPSNIGCMFQSMKRGFDSAMFSIAPPQSFAKT